MTFVKDHLDHFSKYLKSNVWDINEVGGKDFYKFSSQIKGIERKHIKGGKLSRKYLIDLCKNMEVSTLTCCAAIMAWGGMHISHRDLAFEQGCAGWLEIAENIRNGKINRMQAYNQFKESRLNKSLAGMGPAFYTKIIYFLGPDRDDSLGLIMDQWAGCSINVLTGKSVVLMDGNFSSSMKKASILVKYNFIVSNNNTQENYEEFCKLIHALKVELKEDIDIIDRALVSDGRGKGNWRNYVIEQRTPNGILKLT